MIVLWEKKKAPCNTAADFARTEPVSEEQFLKSAVKAVMHLGVNILSYFTFVQRKWVQM